MNIMPSLYVTGNDCFVLVSYETYSDLVKLSGDDIIDYLKKLPCLKYNSPFGPTINKECENELPWDVVNVPEAWDKEGDVVYSQEYVQIPFDKAEAGCEGAKILIRAVEECKENGLGMHELTLRAYYKFKQFIGDK